MRRPLRVSAWHALLRSGLPQRCVLCAGAAGTALVCASCARGLPRLASPCPVCALPSGAAGLAGGTAATCGACLGHPPPYAATLASFVYAFPVDRLLQALKYGGRVALADYAGAELAATVAAALAADGPGRRPQVVCAMPLAPARQRERGFNQAQELARHVAAALGLPLAAPLERRRHGDPQAALAWSARVRNVAGAFTCTGDVRGMRIALVDDVMTTGATVAAAATALLDAGAAAVEAWVVARTLPPGGRVAGSPGLRA
jgi:ComF family protein